MDTVEFLIQSGDNFHKVDIDQSTAFPFNIQISDITEPAVTKIPFSTDISIPKTRNNNNLFQQIWRIDWNILQFNPLERTEFQLYVNNNIFQSGYVKLEQINAREYKIRLFGGLGEYFFVASEIKLKDLGTRDNTETKFGRKFRHTIDKDFLVKAWSESTPYYSDAKDDDGNLIDMRPFFGYAMTYQGPYDNFDSDSYVNSNDDHGIARWYLKEQNKLYTNPELNEHRRVDDATTSTSFFGEYRSYYQRPAIAVKEIYQEIINRMEEEGWKTELDPTFFNDYNPYWADLWMICPQYDTTGDQIEQSIPVSGDIGEYGPDGNLNLEQSINLDGLELNENDSYNVVVNIPFRLQATWYSGNESNSFNKRYPLYISAWLRVGEKTYPLNYNGGQQTIILDSTNLAGKDPGEGQWVGQPFYYQLQDGNGKNYMEKQTGPGSVFTFTLSKEIGQIQGTPTASIIFTLSGSTNWHKQSGNHNNRSMGLVIEMQNGSVDFSSSSGIGKRSGEEITWENIIQSNESCKDFLLSYGKIFNLYYVKDEASKTVRFLTRNSFYGGLERLDWTRKIDYSRDYTLDPVPFNYRAGIMKWEDVGTKYEEEYLNQTAREYGSVRFDTGYQFGDEEKNILEGLMFSNCIVATDYSQYFSGRTITVFKDNKTIPHFQDNSGEGIDANYVLVFRNGVNTVAEDRKFLITDDIDAMLSYGYAWTTNSGARILADTYSNFCRVVERNGELYSLNFGQPKTAYNEQEAELINASDSATGDETLYVRFWRDYLSDRFSAQNRRFTCYVDITLNDVNKYLLDKFIFINDTPWVIERIHAYSPTTHGPTKVSLIAVQNIESYVAQKFIAGNLLLRYAGNYIYDSEGNAAPQTNPVTIRIERESATLLIGLEFPGDQIEGGIEWKIDSYSNGITVTPTAGNGSGSITIEVPENLTGSVINYIVPIRWGNSNTYIQIVQVSNWRITGRSDKGTVLINGEPSPQEVEDGTQILLTVSPDPGYDIAYWIVNNGYIYSDTVSMEVTEDITAVAVMYDTSLQVKVYCYDDNTSIANQTKTGIFWLLNIGGLYDLINTEENPNGFDIEGVERYIAPGGQFQASADTTLITAIYDALLGNILIRNYSGRDYSAPAVTLVSPSYVAYGIPGTVGAGNTVIRKFRADTTEYGLYRFDITQFPTQYAGVAPDEIEYKVGTVPIAATVAVYNIGWENTTVEITQEEQDITNKVLVPDLLTVTDFETSIEGVIFDPETAIEDTEITISIPENQAVDRTITITANYVDNSKRSFMIVQEGLLRSTKARIITQ